jgi:aspartyl-tRNA synthetase
MDNFDKNPRYQAAIRKYMQLSPDVRAVLDLDEVSEAVGTDDLSRELKLIQLGARKTSFEKDLASKESMFKASLAEKTRQADLNYGQKNSWAPLQHALGIGSLGVSGFTAWNKQNLLNNLAASNPDVIYKYLF